MNRQQLEQKIDAEKDKEFGFRLVLEWRGYYGTHKVAYEARRHYNPNIPGYDYSINSLENDLGTRSFDYQWNKSYDSREQFVAAILRRLSQIKKQK